MSKFLAAGVVGGAAGVVAVPLALVVVMAISLDALSGASPAITPSFGQDAAPSAVEGIPALYLRDVEQAGLRFGVSWEVVAAIYHQECDFGQSSLLGCNPPGTENGAGAQGPGQFLSSTWRRSLAPGQVIAPGPPTTTDSGGYATDGDGDGIADPWNPADATASTARLLAANGAASGNVAGAVFAYNHDLAYVQAVLALATTYARAAGPTANQPPGSATLPPGGAGTGAVASVITFADGHLGDAYQWGGSGPSAWDCSGLVQAAYGSVGVRLTHNAAAQYLATASAAVPFTSTLEPGDLVFFGLSLAGIDHVGIVVGDGQMIDAPHTGTVVRVEPYQWPDLIAATRPLT